MYSLAMLRAYLTSKPPTEGKANISRNNYDNPAAGYWESREAQGSVDVGIRVHVPEGKLERVTESRDVWVHRGVYGTSLPPSVGKRKLAENNWGGLWKQHEDAGKVDHAIYLKIPGDKLIQAKSDRDIYIYKGKLVLKDYPGWKTYDLDDFK
nr:hypothetical protein BaRGS_023181 [Batillaria attramentaria]